MIFILLLNIWIFPASWFFFSKFQSFLSFQGLAFYFEAKLNEYLIFYKSIYYLCYLIYQIIVLFFIFLDLFKTNLLIIKKLRKILYFAFFLFATCVTPPEVVYQLITSICIIVVYELFIIHIILKLELTNFK
jgi:Sec-independent protein secretion pathway component TatC